VAALTAKVTDADREFIAKRLNLNEKKLFYGMNLPDQHHALNVAYTAIELAKNYPTVDKEILVRCALLHDVGKQRGDVSTWDKIITVIAHKIFPAKAKAWGRPGRGSKVSNLRHAVYLYFHHPMRSAEMLLAIGTEQKIADIIRLHHTAPLDDDSLELIILRQADDLH